MVILIIYGSFTHCIGLGQGQGPENDGFLYCTMYCTHYTLHRDRDSKPLFSIVPALVPVPVPGDSKPMLPPTNEVCEGYVFTGVCMSTGGVSAPLHAGIHPPGPDPPRSRHPPPQDQISQCGRQVGGTHPTGIHTCFLLCLPRSLSRSWSWSRAVYISH